jgi:hypothetical protein
VFSTSTARLGWRGVPSPQARSVNGTTCLRTDRDLIDTVSRSPYAVDDAASRVPFYLFGDGANVIFQNMGKTGAISFLVADTNPVALNPVAAGSTITATGTTGLTATVVGTPVPSTLDPSSATVNYAFDDTTTEGTITITVRSPGGLGTVFSQRIFRNAVASAPCGP